MDQQPPLIDEQYLRKELIGRGGMGQVYRAYDTRAKRDVAIKFLKGELLEKENSRMRFVREIKTLAQNSSSYIVPLYGYGHLDEVDYKTPPYIVMRLMANSLDQVLIEDQAMDLRVVVYIMERMGFAVDFIASKQIVHRDIKPENIFLDQDFYCYLGDFGIVRKADDVTLTDEGPIGSAHYMSPEQIRGKELDNRSDIYSLGGVLYTLLTGERPFADQPSRHEVLQAHLQAVRPHVSASLGANAYAINSILQRAMAIHPEDRYATAGDLVADLKGLLVGEPLSVHRPPPYFYRDRQDTTVDQPLFAVSADVRDRELQRQNLLSLGITAMIILIIGIGYFALRPKGSAPASPPTIAVAVVITPTLTHTPVPSTATHVPSPTLTAVIDSQPIKIIRNGDSAIWEEVGGGQPKQFILNQRLIPFYGRPIVFESNQELLELVTADGGRFTLGVNGVLQVTADRVKLINGDLLAITAEDAQVIALNDSLSLGIEAGWAGVRRGNQQDVDLQIDCMAESCDLVVNGFVLLTLQRGDRLQTAFSELSAKSVLQSTDTALYINNNGLTPDLLRQPLTITSTPSPATPSIPASPSAMTRSPAQPILNPSSTMPNGNIVYTCFIDGVDQICQLNVESKIIEQLTFDPLTSFYPAYDFSGSLITYSSRRSGAFQLYQLDLASRAVSLLQPSEVNAYAPEFSPDGTKLIYAITHPTNGQIWVYDLISGETKMLTDVPFTDQDPSWSVNSEMIAYVSDRTGRKRHYIMKADGSNDRLIDTDLVGLGGRSDLSPDGSWLAAYADAGNGANNIYLIPVNGGNAVQLTSSGDNLAPSFSPDGNWIVFTSYRNGESDSELYAIRIDGQQLIKLTDNTSNDWQPRWGP